VFVGRLLYYIIVRGWSRPHCYCVRWIVVYILLIYCFVVMFLDNQGVIIVVWYLLILRECWLLYKNNWIALYVPHPGILILEIHFTVLLLTTLILLIIYYKLHGNSNFIVFSPWTDVIQFKVEHSVCVYKVLMYIKLVYKMKTLQYNMG